MGDCVNDTTEVVFENIIESYRNRAVLKSEIDNTLNNFVQPRLQKIKAIISENIKI